MSNLERVRRVGMRCFRAQSLHSWLCTGSATAKHAKLETIVSKKLLIVPERDDLGARSP